MSAPVRRALPPIPSDSSKKAPGENKNEPIPEKDLASAVPKKPPRSSSELPRLPLDRQEFPDDMVPEVTGSPESQTSPPQRLPPPIPQVSPTSPTKLVRRVTAGKKPDPLKLPKQPKTEKKVSFPTYSLSPRTVDIQSAADYGEELDNLATELAGVVEIKTSERSDEKKSESESPKKKPGSSSHPTSTEDLDTAGQSLSVVRNRSSRLLNLSLLSRVTRLPTEHRRPTKSVSATPTPKDPGDAGAGPEN